MKKILSLLFAGMLLFSGAACNKEKKEEINVYTPDGAPALALAELMSKDTEEDGVTYNVVSSAGIEAYVQYEDESKNADICILPLTDASLYLNSGEKYALLGTVTHGNFFIVSEREESYTLENLSSLIGKKIGVVQLPKLPGLTLRCVLEREQIPYAVKESVDGAEEGKINLINVAPTSVKGGTAFDAFVIPEPLASVKTKTGFYRAGSLQTLYGGEEGYPQAAIVAKRSLIEKEPAFIEEFISDLSTCKTWLETAEISVILQAVNSHLQEGITPSFSDKNLTREAILGCNVYFADAKTQKTMINSFISALQVVNPNAVKTLSDTFFYE